MRALNNEEIFKIRINRTKNNVLKCASKLKKKNLRKYPLFEYGLIIIGYRLSINRNAQDFSQNYHSCILQITINSYDNIYT